MKKTYNPKEIEQIIYQDWEKKGYFNTDNIKEKNFCIMLPPPNITGYLHMGHAFQQTIMDTLVRYHRMSGKNTLWQIGTDHAGIATQIVVEKKMLSEEGKNRRDYSRKEFIKKILNWKDESSNKIIYQMKRLGNSANWHNERFTMDKGFSRAVKKVFIELYKDNLIYRMKSLVNWDTKLRTAISDLEIEKRKVKGFMWYIRYPLADDAITIDGNKYLTVATTRPETLIGDTALVINPKDYRYKNLKNKFAIVPIMNRKIPIIYDEYADINKGYGCVKITPAHDFNDYAVGIRNKLVMINIINTDGKTREKLQVYDSSGKKSIFYSDFIPEKLRNLNNCLVRERIVNELKEHGYLEKVISHNLNIPYSERSGVKIEPMLTSQWYVRTKLLSRIAIKAVKNKKIKFVPIQYENMYFSWMNNIHDWCISRQLWWGHRIPAWYDNNNNIYVGYSEKQVRKENLISDNIKLKQDKDVLDTWFSSALWTFVSLGWPEKKDKLNIFHPTDILISGFDIIFFWIARMIMMTMHFIKNKDGSHQIPFKTVYITGLVRDDFGIKMSKSKGNVIDPLDIIDGISLNELLKKRTNDIIYPKLKEKIYQNTRKQFPNGIKPYGADALRFTLLALASHGRDIYWDMQRLQGYRNFCNKLWNASKFVLLQSEKIFYYSNSYTTNMTIADKWIISEFNQTVKLWHEAILNYRFDIVANLIYEFTWNQFCDWYLELAKIFINIGTEVELITTTKTLVNIFESLLRLAHPIIPFITESIWNKIKVFKNIKGNTIMLESLPQFSEKKVYNEATSDFNWIKQVVILVRNIKCNMQIKNNQLTKIIFYKLHKQKIFLIQENFNLLKKALNTQDIILDTILIKDHSKSYYFLAGKKTLTDGTEVSLIVKNNT